MLASPFFLQRMEENFFSQLKSVSWLEEFTSLSSDFFLNVVIQIQ